MKSQIEFLEESRDGWKADAEHDKKQLLTSFAIAAAGIMLMGVGIGSALKGEIVGAIEGITVGVGIAVPYAKLGYDEVKDFADMTALAAIRQSQIDDM